MIENLENTDGPLQIRDLVANQAPTQVFEIVPFSTLDQQVISHFDNSLALLVEKIDNLEKREDPQDKNRAAVELEMDRSKLFADRACYEIKVLDLLPEDSARDAELPYFVDQVTDFSDKLSVFRQALVAGNMTALSWLGDLREEAENHALGNDDDPSYLAAYLVEELRAGFNVHTNRDLIRTLAKGISGSSGIRADKISSSYTSALVDAVLDAIVDEDTDLAISLTGELNKISSTAKSLSSLIRIRQEKLQLKDVAKFSKFKDSQNLGLRTEFLKMRYADLARENYLYKPYDIIVFAAIDPTLSTRKLAGIFTNCFIEEGNSWLGEKQEDFLAVVNPGVAREYRVFKFDRIKENHYKGRYSQESPQALMDMSLLANMCEIEDENERSQKEVEAELDMLADEYARYTCKKVNHDLVDRTRFRTTYNGHIAKLFNRADAISSAPYRFRAMAKVLILQAMHDTGSRSNFSGMLSKLEGVSDKCEASAVDRSLLTKEERDAAIERIMKIAFPENQQTAQTDAKEDTNEED